MTYDRNAAIAHSEATPAIMVRKGANNYSLAHLGDVVWVPAHVDERQYMNLNPGKPFLSKPHKVHVPDVVRVSTPRMGSLTAVRADRLAEAVRRPSNKALARVEAAEAAVRAAKAELQAAKRAAFAYGKPIPLSTVKAADRARRKAVEK